MKFCDMDGVPVHCVYCYRTENLQTDHVIPVGGHAELKYDPMNCQILCEYCNVHRKGSGHQDWRDQRFMEYLKERVEKEWETNQVTGQWGLRPKEDRQ